MSGPWIHAPWSNQPPWLVWVVMFAIVNAITQPLAWLYRRRLRRQLKELRRSARRAENPENNK